MASSPTLLGVPLRHISLFVLVVQNSALTILLHYSRTVVPADEMYSAASAVLLNELLKGSISISIAFRNALLLQPASLSLSAYAPLAGSAGVANELEKRGGTGEGEGSWREWIEWGRLGRAANKMRGDVFSDDCWKLSIPACLYVIQNNLQFVAASNLDVPTFQVSYNLKILTTALFSVILLHRRLTQKKWLALLCLAAGVGIVQLQSSAASGGGGKGHAGEAEMNRLKGLLAVGSACMTSGLAGVYFEMVLKGSQTDLWIRNVQLSFFSLLPALVPVFFPNFSLFPSTDLIPQIPAVPQAIFAHFGIWAWAVVLTQVVGGLVTALVIKYSDNIMKGFATSLAIVLSFLAGVVLFQFRVTASFLVGSSVVVGATYLYNLPEAPPSHALIRQSPPPTPQGSLSYPPSSRSPLALHEIITSTTHQNHHRTTSTSSAAFAGDAEKGILSAGEVIIGVGIPMGGGAASALLRDGEFSPRLR